MFTNTSNFGSLPTTYLLRLVSGAATSANFDANVETSDSDNHGFTGVIVTIA